jgi:hypothetical protein
VDQLHRQQAGSYMDQLNPEQASSYVDDQTCSVPENPNRITC